MAAEIAGYCGRCGAPFPPGATGFCGRCGNSIGAQPPQTAGYQYPVVPATAVPGARQKLGRGRLYAFGGGAAAVLVVIITVVVVVVKPGSHPCGFYCGPVVGPPLTPTAAYTSSQFGFRVPYEQSHYSVKGQDASSIQLSATVGSGACTDGLLGEIDVTGVAGTDVGGALQQATNNLQSSALTQLQPNGTINGAEVGNLTGMGAAFTATYNAPDNSGQGFPASAVVMAATDGTSTIVVTAWSEQSQDVAPYGVCNADPFDAVASGIVWKGQ